MPIKPECTTCVERTMRFKIPAALYDTASAIFRALDQDVGGALSFGPKLDPAPAFYETDFPCCACCVARFGEIQTDAAAFKDCIAQQYAQRFHEMTPPTDGEIEAFITSVEVTE